MYTDISYVQSNINHNMRTCVKLAGIRALNKSQTSPADGAVVPDIYHSRIRRH